MQRQQIPILGGAYLELTWDADGTSISAAGRAAGPVLGDILRRLGNRQPFVAALFNIARKSFRKTFQEGGRPRWIPLKPATVARKQALIDGGALPTRTKTGRIPLRVKQRPLGGGELVYSAGNMLIERGDLARSWCEKGAKGHVEEVRGDQIFIGSQLTVEGNREGANRKLFSGKSKGLKGRGNSVPVRIPLALIHQLGSERANIPARSVALVAEDYEAIQDTTVEWMRGDLNA